MPRFRFVSVLAAMAPTPVRAGRKDVQVEVRLRRGRRADVISMLTNGESGLGRGWRQ